MTPGNEITDKGVITTVNKRKKTYDKTIIQEQKIKLLVSFQIQNVVLGLISWMWYGTKTCLCFLFSDTRHCQTPAKKKVDTGPDFTDNMKAQCKEEQEHIPIIKISSVCSMASPNPSPDRKVILITCDKMYEMLHNLRRTLN